MPFYRKNKVMVKNKVTSMLKALVIWMKMRFDRTTKLIIIMPCEINSHEVHNQKQILIHLNPFNFHVINSKECLIWMPDSYLKSVLWGHIKLRFMKGSCKELEITIYIYVRHDFIDIQSRNWYWSKLIHYLIGIEDQLSKNL